MWDKVKLADLVTFISRGKSPAYVDESPIKALNQKAIRWGGIDQTALKYHNPDVEIREELFIKKGDIVLNSTGDITIGRAFYFRDEVKDLFADSHVTILRFNTNKILPQFVVNLFPLPHYQTKIYNLVTGATGQLELTRSELLKLEIDVPPLPIQNRIAEILGRYDALKENYQQQIRNLEALAQSLYREWFVRGRCPFATYERDSKLPTGWERITIGDVCTIGRGSSPRPIDDNIYFEDGTIPWIKIADATASGKFLYETREHVNAYGASFSRYLNEGSLIIATSGTLGFCLLLGVKGCVHDGWLYISEYRDGTTPSFMYFVINSLTEYFNNLSYGAAIQNINTDILRETSMILPTRDVLNKFSEVIHPIDRKIDNLSKQLIQLKKMRDRLLPRLMSGQIPIEVAE